MADVKVTFDAADDYERYMGRWSRAIGVTFLDWLEAPKQATWLDVGCGTGAFSELIVTQTAPHAVTGVDPAPAQIDYARRHIKGPTFRVGDALALPFAAGEFDIVVSALVLHFLPDRLKGFAEMQRVAKPGALVAGYTWQRGAGLPGGAPYTPMIDALRTIGVDAERSPTVPEGSPDGLRSTLTQARFHDIEVRTIEATQTFRDFDDYWSAQTPSFAPVAKSVLALGDSDRDALRAVLHNTLPTTSDGAIRYPATAVAFKARR